MSTNTKIPIRPAALIRYLEWAEVDSSREAICRRVLRDERMRLVVAVNAGDAAAIAQARDEAVRVAKMWAPF